MKEYDVHNNYTGKNKQNLKKVREILEDDNLKNLYCIFTIDKEYYDKSQFKIQIARKDVNNQITQLIKSDEKSNGMLNQIHCISFLPKQSSINETNIFLQINDDLSWIYSKIYFKSKQFIFIYKYGLEDINANSIYRKMLKIKVKQNKLDFYAKYVFFLKALKLENWENKSLSMSFVEDTLDYIQREEKSFIIILNLLEMCYKRTNFFYKILEIFYFNQNRIFFPENLNFSKYKKLIDDLNDMNNLYYSYDNKNNDNFNVNYIIDKRQILEYFEALKETLYRKFDNKNYIKLAEDKNFLEIIKKQVTSEFITKTDNIPLNIICDMLKLSKSKKEIELILKLCPNTYQVLNVIAMNYDFIEDIYNNSKKTLNIIEIIDFIEDDSFEKVKELHNLILELEKKKPCFFIDFSKIIKKYINRFENNNLTNLIFLREMIYNHQIAGDFINEIDDIKYIVRQTACNLASLGKLPTIEIIYFIIQSDEMSYYSPNDLRIFRAIDINVLEEKDFSIFRKIWSKIDKKNINDLMEIILDKIKYMKDFSLIFKLVPENIIDSVKLNLLENKFIDLFSSYNDSIFNNLIKDICNLLILYKNNNFQSDNLLNNIEANIPKKKLSDLYINIIKNKYQLSNDEALKKRILQFYTNVDFIVDSESVIYILENINSSNNQEFINDFINGLDKYILTERDFFTEQSNNKFKLYSKIHHFFLSNNKSCDNNYFKMSNLTLNNLYDKIINLEIKFDDAISLKNQLNQKYFEEKLKLLSQTTYKYLYDILDQNIKKLEVYQKKLLKAQNFYKFYFVKSENSFINEIGEKIQLLKENYLNNSLIELEEFFKTEKYKFVEKFYKINESYFFMGLYLYNKNKYPDDEALLFEETLKSFNELKILNKWEDNFCIKKIPYCEIISKEIEKIINENKDSPNSKENENNCISLIAKELKIINNINLNSIGYIQRSMTSNNLFIPYKSSINFGENNENEEKKINLVQNDEIFEEEEEEDEEMNYDKISDKDNLDFSDKISDNHKNYNKIIQIKNNNNKNNNNHSNKLRQKIIGNEYIPDIFQQTMLKNNNNKLIDEENYDIAKSLLYLPFLDSLKKIINSITLLIDLFKVKQTFISTRLNAMKIQIQKKEKSLTLIDIQNSIEELKKLNCLQINIACFTKNDQTSILVEFFTILFNNEEGIKFAFDKTNDEIRALSEFVGETENSKIQIRDIQDFMNVCNFFDAIKSLRVEEDYLLIEEFKNAFMTMPTFGNSFRNYLNNFREIKNVYEEYLDKPEVSRKKIEQILKSSNIKIFLDDNTRLIKVKGDYTDILNNAKIIYNSDLQELHDRALLFSNKTYDNMANNVTEKIEEKQKNSKIFAEIVENINTLVSYLTSLYIKGYPFQINVNILIKKSKATSSEGDEDIKKIINFYKNLAANLETTQIEAYKSKPLIRLIYGQQFYDIYNYLLNKNIDIIPLLKKLSDNQIKIIPNIADEINNNLYNENLLDFNNMINKINNFLAQCMNINHIGILDFYKKNIIKENLKQKIKPGFYSWNIDEVNSEIQIISLYKKLTGNLPLSITLLLCTKETSEEEITSFIYRALLCKHNALFLVANSDNLELSKAQYFLWLLESLYNENRYVILSVLLISFNDTNSSLRKQLTLMNGHEYFIDGGDIGINDMTDFKNDKIANPIEIWTSDVTGLGKSTKIKFEAKNLNLNYLYFPIGGSFTRKEIIKRLCKLDIDKKNTEKNFLHIDIYDSDKESSFIIREFLFSLLISRNYTYEDKTFYFDYAAKIIVEIPKGFYNMKDKFKLLNYFTIKELNLNDLPDLMETEEITDKNKLTDIQLVTHILMMSEDNSIKEELFDLEKTYETIPLDICQKIINKSFTLKQGNYYQKIAFIHILADQFRKFCSSFYLRPDVLIQSEMDKKRYRVIIKDKSKISLIKRRRIIEEQNKINNKNNKNDLNLNNSPKITNIRKIMIDNLVKLTLYFVKGPYNKIVLNQEKTNKQLFGEYDEKKINEIAIESLSKKDEIISFDKINPSLVFFNEDIQTFSIITTSKPGEDEYNQLLKLYNSQLDIQYEQQLIDYRSLTHEDFIPHVKNVLNLNTLSLEKIMEIVGSYCFTSDNFIKMILILLRTRAGIPVILMGETGCGKTSLIKILSTLLNNGTMNLKIKNIHAGIKDQDIIDYIEEVNEEANKNDKNIKDKMWVFFDEINTCNSMGLLSEIFYKHTYHGKPLNKKLTFIAACNPYRLQKVNPKEKEEDNFCLISPDKNYNHSKQKLVYLVNPLPHSLLTSIFDFGNLSSEDEKKYIISIVKETVKNFFLKSKDEDLIVKGILKCHNYIRDSNDVSSVSLRELRRFNILYKFFVDYIQKKNIKEKSHKNNDKYKYIASLCLCLYFCYHIRISNNKLRAELGNLIKREINEKYYDIIEDEQKFIIQQIKIPPGIAKNHSLLENVFSIFVCVVNKIPLIICGKPGTSKSLSFQLLYDSMKGDRSENDFFKNYPELLVFSYQGSKTSTSEGVKNVFNKARNCLIRNIERNKKNEKSLNIINENNIGKTTKDFIKKDKDIDSIIPVVYFDEMGLAEESPNNPLKVIHSELEYDDNEQKVGFIGISNWILDASKMNRTIFLGVPTLDEKQLNKTAEEISSNLDENLSNQYSDLFSNLVKTYCEYKNDIKATSQSEFHGLRDFYHLIKNAMNYLIADNKKIKKNKIKNIKNNINSRNFKKINIKEKDEEKKEEMEEEDDENNDGDDIENINITQKSYEIGIKSLKRNFDGLKIPFNSFEKIKKIFDKFYKNKKDININLYNNYYNVFNCLEDNVSDNESRYLLIIIESSMSLHLLRYIMQKLGKNYIFYSGSQLKDDVNQEKYNEKLLNKIQLSLENGDILVLKNMENIYPSLYNLFNQNFTMLGGKKFARIAFANYKSYSVVHNDFRAIVLVDEEQIKEKMEDPPFLNRFEKHSFSFEYLMDNEQLKIANKIIKYIDKVVCYNKKNCKIDLKKQLLWYNEEEIKGLVFREYDKFKDNKEDKEIINDNILKNLSKLLSQDIIASIVSINSDKEISNKILDFYKQNHYHNFQELLNNKKDLFTQGKSCKLIIYTFSKLLEPCIKGDNNINSYEMLKRNNISEKIIDSIKNENDVDGILEDYYNNNEKKILVFKFSEDDLNKMNQMNLRIRQFENERKKIDDKKMKNKHYIFLISLARKKLENKNKKIKMKKTTINDLISNIDEEYSQFFIDNLHGKIDKDILKVLEKTPLEFIKEVFNKQNNYIQKILHQIFSYLIYEFKNEKTNKNLNKNTYVSKIINELSKNEYVLSLIVSKIEKEFGGNINETINSIFTKGNFEKNDIEFIDCIYKVTNDKIMLLLFKFIFKAEKDHFLNPLLFNYTFFEKEKENMAYIEKYINNFEFSLVQVVERINSNQISLILNLSLPLSKKWYDAINLYIENNIKEDYINNEEKLRTQIFEKDQINKELEKYSKTKNDFIDNVKGELLRTDGLNDLIKGNNLNYIRMIYIDFLTIYLTKQYKENIDDGLQFLDVLIQLKLNINKDNKYSFIDNYKKKINLQNSFCDFNSMKTNKKINDIKNVEMNIKYDEDTLSKILIFLISYSEEIYSLLEIFYNLNKYLNEDNNFIDSWKEIITQKKVKYVINDNIPEYTREVNESFFIIYESLIKCIFNYQDKYKNIPEDIFYEYLNSIQKLSKTATQIYYKLYLPSNEIYTLQILINIFTTSNSCKKQNHMNNIQESFANIISIIAIENELISNKNYQELEENYANLYVEIEKLIDGEINEKEYALLLNNIFVYRYNKSLDKEYRKAISLIFFSNISSCQLNYILPILKRLIDNIEPKILLDEDEEDYKILEKECLQDFMNTFINVDKDKIELFEILNEKNDDNLDLNILYFFECECNLYFKKLEKGKKISEIGKSKAEKYMNDILLNLSFKYFEKAMNYYLDESTFKRNVKKFGKMYCISYIKNYLKRLSQFIIYNIDKNILNFNSIFDVLLRNNKNKQLIYSLKVFLFKCLFKLESKNYLNFIESIKSKNDIQTLIKHDDFQDLFSLNENRHSYNFSFININTFEYYCKLVNMIDLSQDDFNKDKEFGLIAEYINNNNIKGFDLLYNILINKYILDMFGNNKNKEISENAKKIFGKFNEMNINLHENSKTIINYILNDKLFKSKILPKLKLKDNITSEQLYILLLCIKFVILIQYSKNNLFSLFYIEKKEKKHLIDFINDNFIIGAFLPKNDFIESYYEIEEHLRTQPSKNAIYICSCGKYYNVPPCGFPTEISKCVKCHLDIGGLKHILVKREGHYRIFLDEKARKEEYKRSYADKNMKYKYLADFKKTVIDPLLNSPIKGIGKMTKEIINKTGNNIRKIDELSFRILNLILCSNLLVSNILDILDDNDISNYFSEETSCFGIILDNWQKIGDMLNKKGINNIQIYMNVIYEELINIIINYQMKDINTIEGRDMIENEINKFITEDNGINNKIKKYEEQNQKILNSSPENISSIIQELYPMKLYSDEKKYPYFKYLSYYTYPNINNLYNIIQSNDNYKNKYPLTYNILKYNISSDKEIGEDSPKSIDLLRYIPKINKKLNYLIQNYSYKISRSDASERTIKDEYYKKDNNLFVLKNINKKDKKVNDYLKDVINLFKKFKNVNLQWGCHKLQKMELSSDSNLVTILLDDNEPGYYLSSIYKKLIEYQNVVLDNIINCNSQNGLLHCFVRQLNSEMMIQDATDKEIIKFDFEDNNNNNIKLYSSIDELIFINTINNSHINKFEYELDQIEIELGNIILPGVRKFKSSDDELRYITYMFEGYRGKNSNILTNFNEKYPPQDLDYKEKQILNKYIKNNEGEDYKAFLFSLQLLIDYIQKTGKPQNILIRDVINDMPDHIIIFSRINRLNYFLVKKY